MSTQVQGCFTGITSYRRTSSFVQQNLDNTKETTEGAHHERGPTVARGILLINVDHAAQEQSYHPCDGAHMCSQVKLIPVRTTSRMLYASNWIHCVVRRRKQTTGEAVCCSRRPQQSSARCGSRTSPNEVGLHPDRDSLLLTRWFADGLHTEAADTLVHSPITDHRHVSGIG